MSWSQRILVIDDNQDQLSVISRAIAKSNPAVTVVTAVNENEVRVLLQNEVLPDVILLDLYMPRQEDGLRILTTLKQQLKQQRQLLVPVVVLSSSADPEDIKTCYDCGANAYITKPIEFETLVNLFKRFATYWLDTVTLPDSYRLY